jgi:hypothetical protein
VATELAHTHSIARTTRVTPPPRSKMTRVRRQKI